MTVEFKESFVQRFERQLRFIADDSPVNARKFKTDLLKHIKSLTDTPLKCRKSIYFNDDTMRDLVYKGYTNHDKIEVFGFTKYQQAPLD